MSMKAGGAVVVSMDMERLSRAAEVLFPPAVCIVLLPVEESERFTSGFSEEEAVIGGVCALRKRQYRAGRYAAHTALRRCGAPDIPLLNHEDGFIHWPEGWTGSISHTAAICLAAVTRSCEGQSLGVDIEETRRMTDPIARRILLPEELNWISASPNDEPLSRAALLFSAKEALYKTLAPIVRRYIGFREACLIPMADARGWSFIVRFPDDSNLVPYSNRLTGRGVLCDGWSLAGFRMSS